MIPLYLSMINLPAIPSIDKDCPNPSEPIDDDSDNDNDIPIDLYRKALSTMLSLTIQMLKPALV